jgi:hypothetical protein
VEAPAFMPGRMFTAGAKRVLLTVPPNDIIDQVVF